MEQLADDVFRISVMPRDGMNVYLLGDVLVDAGMAGSAKKIASELEGRTVTEHAITHAHPDHAGGSSRVIAALGLDGIAAGDLDAEAAEAGETAPSARADNPIGRFFGSYDGVRVARRLREGDQIGPGFTVLDVPGHSPGHVAYWRESDGVLICGDVFFNMNILTTIPGLRQPPGLFTPDPERNRESERKLAALEPRIVGFGHGPVMRDAAGKLAAFVAKL
jgi:glyoxylase-like metal-dependent hydrolase (beta-lactamase superfamily II)